FCADGARLELHRSLWRTPGSRAFEASAGGCVRVLLARCLHSFCGEPRRLRIAAHQKLVAADLPALPPVEEGHAEQARAPFPGLGGGGRARGVAVSGDAKSGGGARGGGAARAPVLAVYAR